MSDDLISRQAAIDALERKKDKKAKGDMGGFYNKIIQNDIDALMQLPSAQPERKKGKWIDEPIYKQTMDGKTWDGFTYCSECQEMHEYGYRSKFCPNCGAEMKGEEDANVQRN